MKDRTVTDAMFEKSKIQIFRHYINMVSSTIFNPSTNENIERNTHFENLSAIIYKTKTKTDWGSFKQCYLIYMYMYNFHVFGQYFLRFW